MAISYVNGASGNASSINLPSGWSPGDIALVMAVNNTSTIPSLPSGWTQLNTDNTNSLGARWGYRILQSGDTTTGTWTGDSVTLIVVIYSGVHQQYPLDTALGLSGAGFSSTATIYADAGCGYATSVEVGFCSAAGVGKDFSTTSLTNRSSGYSAVSIGVADKVGALSSDETYALGANTFWKTQRYGLRQATDFPIVVDTNTTSGTVTSNSSSWTLTYPSNIAAGDLLLAFVAQDGNPAGFSTPSGWVGALWNSAGGTANGILVFKKLATGSESGTFTLTLGASEQGSWAIYRIPAGTWYGSIGTGFSNSDTSAGVVGDVTNGADSNPNSPSLDPANWGAENALWFAASSSDTSRTYSAYPSSPDTFTNTGYLASGGSTGATLAWARLEKNASSVDPGTFTHSASDDWAAVTIAVRPRQYFSVVAQANAQITGGYKQSYAQAQATIKAFNIRSYAQSLAGIKVVDNRSYAQIQAKIIIIAKAYAQANVLINGTYFMPLIDTFTRSVGSGLGVSESGDTWTNVMGVDANASVDGSKAVIIPAARGIWGLRKTLITTTSGFQLSLKIAIDKIPTASSSNGLQINIGYGSVETAAELTANKVGLSIHTTTSGQLWLSSEFFSSGFGSGTVISSYVVGDTYNIVVDWYRISGGKWGSRRKIWKEGTSEPGWMNIWGDAEGTGIFVPGHILVEAPFDASNNNPITSILDNFQIKEAQITFYAQAQSKIKAFGVQSYAQAQAQLLSGTATYQSYAQAQSQIKTAYQGYAQGLSKIQVIDNRQYAQAQAQIKFTSYSQAQANTYIKTSNSVYAQAQTEIVLPTNTHNGFGQGNALIGVTTNLYSFIDESVPDTSDRIIGPPNSQNYYEAQLTSTSTPDYLQDIVIRFRAFVPLFLQAGVSVTLREGAIERAYKDFLLSGTETEYVYNLTPAEISSITDYSDLRLRFAPYDVTTDERVVITWAQVQLPSASGIKVRRAFAQAQAQISGATQSYAQAQAHIKITGIAYAQAQAQIKQTYQFHAQANVYIKTTDIRAYAQAQAHIKTTYQVFAQAQGQIKQAYQGHAQSQAQIEQAYQQFAQAQAQVKRTYQAYAQGQAQIKQTYQVFAQANAKIILSNLQAYAQSQAQIKVTYQGYAQAQGKIILSGNLVYAQALAQIKTTYQSYAQVQAQIKATSLVYAQALAQIEVSYSQHAQAQAWIKSTYQAYAQAQVSIYIPIASYNQFAQAQATIKQAYQGYGQSQSSTKSKYLAHAQAPSWIKQTYPLVAGNETIAQDSFTETGNIFLEDHTPEIGGSWVRRINNAKWSIDATSDRAVPPTSWDYSQYSIGPTLSNGYVQAYTLPGGAGYSQLTIRQITSTLNYYYAATAGALWRITGGNVTLLSYYTGTGDYVRVQATGSSPTSLKVEARASVGQLGTGWQLETTDNTAGNNAANTGYVGIWGESKDDGDGYTISTGPVDDFIAVSFGSGIIGPTFAQSQATIRSTYQKHSQAQATVKSTYQAYVQANTYIKTTGLQAFAQGQAQIKQTYQTWAQANAHIRLEGLQVYGQALATIKIIATQIGQSQALIKRTEVAYAQAQSHIKSTYLGYAQAQGQINRAYTEYAQAQASIIGVSQAYAQAQAKLNAFAVNAHAQAQTIIEGSFTQYAQAQAKINAFDIQAYGQSQVWIKTTYNAYAQAQAQINATYLAYAQGQAQIKTSYQVYGQAQAQISQTYQAYAQANAYIKVTDNSAFAQAQASIKSTYLVYAQAHGLIVASYYGYAQAQSYIIVRDIEAYAQAGATIMASGYMYAQAEVWIYIPQIARPIADISNDGNWVGTVRD